MAAVRGAAERCPSYASDPLPDGTRIQETASVTAAGVPADDGLLLHITSTFPEDGKQFFGVTAFVRLGEVILIVQQSSEDQPSSDSETVLAAAVKAYRSAAAGG
ncbi:hypothetical protein ACFV0O_40115 [Kitasatospora sp. NPDC059577]